MKEHFTPKNIGYAGVSVCVILLGYVFFHHLLPNQKKTQYYAAYVQELQDEADKLFAAKKRVALAQATVAKMAKDWQAVVEKHTPPCSVAEGGINIGVQRWQLTVDARHYRNSLQRELNLKVRHGGVTVINGPEVPFPGSHAESIVEDYFNYPAVPFPVAILDVGPVSVRGTFPQIMEHMRVWSDIKNCMVFTHDLKLTGTSPYVVGTYDMVVLAYIRGDQVGPSVPEDSELGSKGTPSLRRRA